MQETLYKPFTNSPSAPQRLRQSWLLSRQAAPILIVLVLLGLWQFVVMLDVYPAFIIPPPQSVLSKFGEVVANGSLWLHTSTTLYATLIGLVAGVSIGVALGYLIAKSQLLETFLSPLIVAFQSMPVVAYAPLLIIWFGSGPTSKIVTSALIVFFPMLMNTIVGIRNVPAPLRDLMRSMQATPWQTFTK